MNSNSLLRREEYKALAALSIDGAVLDVGGSKKSGYHELIGGTHTITVGNIDPSYGIDLIFDAEQPWPFPEASFEGVLLVNILEHLYAYDFALRESVRVLKPGGTLAGVVPFLLNIHSAPRDYFRFTRFTLERALMEHGFTEVQVRELGTGAFSVIYQTLLPFMRFGWLAATVQALCVGLDRLSRLLKPANNPLSPSAMPLGYYFQAKK